MGGVEDKMDPVKGWRGRKPETGGKKMARIPRKISEPHIVAGYGDLVSHSLDRRPICVDF